MGIQITNVYICIHMQFVYYMFIYFRYLNLYCIEKRCQKITLCRMFPRFGICIAFASDIPACFL